MSIGGDAADQMVKEGIEITEAAVKLAGLGAKNLAALLLALLKDQQKLKGETSVGRLLKEDKPLSIFHVKKADLGEFRRLAGQYGVLYTPIYNKKAGRGLCDVLVKAEDANKVNRILETMKYPAPEKNAGARAQQDGKSSGRGNGLLYQMRERMNNPVKKYEGKTARLEGLGAETLAALVLQVAKDNARMKDASPLSRLFGEGKELQVVDLPALDAAALQKQAAALDIPLFIHDAGDGRLQMTARTEDAPVINRLAERMGHEPPMREGRQEPEQKRSPGRPKKEQGEKPSVKDTVQAAKDKLPAPKKPAKPKEKGR